jgi:hypothetical protein
LILLLRDGLQKLPDGADIPAHQLPEDFEDGGALLRGEADAGPVLLLSEKLLHRVADWHYRGFGEERRLYLQSKGLVSPQKKPDRFNVIKLVKRLQNCTIRTALVLVIKVERSLGNPQQPGKICLIPSTVLPVRHLLQSTI